MTRRPDATPLSAYEMPIWDFLRSGLPRWELTPLGQQIVAENIPLAYWICRRYPGLGRGLPEEEREEMAVAALIDAAAYHDASRARFSTYATWSIVRRLRQSRTARESQFAPFAEEEIPAREEEIDRADEAREDLLDALRRAVGSLPDRSGHIVRQRLLGRSLASIGAGLGISKERVRQLQTKAHGQLRAGLMAEVGR